MNRRMAAVGTAVGAAVLVVGTGVVLASGSDDKPQITETELPAETTVVETTAAPTTVPETTVTTAAPALPPPPAPTTVYVPPTTVYVTPQIEEPAPTTQAVPSTTSTTLCFVVPSDPRCS